MLTKMPTLILTDTFKYKFDLLTELEKKQARKALRFLAENPKHLSLQIHRIQGTSFWEAYVNKDIRIIYEQTGDTFVLRTIGHHDILRKF
jgi:mRNA-degrading endonuclease YafQ of YafQ-DinJ toxin-antitoxin module